MRTFADTLCSHNLLSNRLLDFRTKSIEAKGLGSTGNSHKVAFAAESDAYNTSESRVS